MVLVSFFRQSTMITELKLKELMTNIKELGYSNTGTELLAGTNVHCWSTNESLTVDIHLRLTPVLN